MPNVHCVSSRVRNHTRPPSSYLMRMSRRDGGLHSKDGGARRVRMAEVQVSGEVDEQLHYHSTCERDQLPRSGRPVVKVAPSKLVSEVQRHATQEVRRQRLIARPEE